MKWRANRRCLESNARAAHYRSKQSSTPTVHESLLIDARSAEAFGWMPENWRRWRNSSSERHVHTNVSGRHCVRLSVSGASACRVTSSNGRRCCCPSIIYHLRLPICAVGHQRTRPGYWLAAGEVVKLSRPALGMQRTHRSAACFFARILPACRWRRALDRASTHCGKFFVACGQRSAEIRLLRGKARSVCVTPPAALASLRCRRASGLRFVHRWRDASRGSWSCQRLYNFRRIACSFVARYVCAHGFVQQPNKVLKPDAPHSALSRTVVMHKIPGPLRIIAARRLALRWAAQRTRCGRNDKLG